MTGRRLAPDEAVQEDDLYWYLDDDKNWKCESIDINNVGLSSLEVCVGNDWIERPSDPSAVDRLVEAAKKARYWLESYCEESDSYYVDSARIEMTRLIDALAAVEKERGQDA
jgi:hypothetical protein